MEITLEEWISDLEQVRNEKQILLEHGSSLDEWNQKFLREQIEMWNDRLALLYELKGYREKAEETKN
jgi:hypothetical protein